MSEYLSLLTAPSFYMTMGMTAAYASAMLAIDLNDDGTRIEFWISYAVLAMVYFTSISINENWNIVIYCAGWALSKSVFSLIEKSN